MSQQCALVAMKASCILDCVSKNTASRLRSEQIALHLALVWLLLEDCAVSGSQCKRNRLELVQHRAMKMVKGLENDTSHSNRKARKVATKRPLPPPDSTF
ncbi:hypothetical protein QYF61_012339 [Mycteria americana]|uniref:Uncharacterized protein n=1 Tax=Mycteria americana TaxID=33587 RepID=A0AAN7S3A5_MYCAM|nr:hypothetical protein QYF61_012339 [Mycteria americana]